MSFSHNFRQYHLLEKMTWWVSLISFNFSHYLPTLLLALYLLWWVNVILILFCKCNSPVCLALCLFSFGPTVHYCSFYCSLYILGLFWFMFHCITFIIKVCFCFFFFPRKSHKGSVFWDFSLLKISTHCLYTWITTWLIQYSWFPFSFLLKLADFAIWFSEIRCCHWRCKARLIRFPCWSWLPSFFLMPE